MSAFWIRYKTGCFIQNVTENSPKLNSSTGLCNNNGGQKHELVITCIMLLNFSFEFRHRTAHTRRLKTP